MKKTLVVVAALLLFALGAEMSLAQSGYDLYQKALVKERAVGDVEEAIRLYQRIVKEFASNRALAAKAQLRIGLLYERLGRKAEAHQAFQAVVTQYADQADVVKQAQAKLTAIANERNANVGANDREATGLRVRKVMAGPDVNPDGAVSPDGRYLPYTDNETKNLAIRDLVTGEMRRLTNKNSKDEWADTSIFSPDSKQIAYSWGSNKDKKESYELRLIGIDGAGARVLYPPDDVYLEPFAWSPDGKYVLALIEFFNEEPKNRMALISVADGSARILKAVNQPGGGWDAFNLVRFSPDGRYIAYEYQLQKDSPQHDLFIMSSDGSPDLPLVQSPADEKLLGWAPDGKSILFTSDRSKTIDAWIIPVADGKPQGSPELVKRDMGRIWPLGFTRSGSFYYCLSGTGASDIYIATLAPETGKLIGSPVLAKTRFIGFNGGLDWSPDGRHLVYKSSPRMREGNAAGDKLFILNPETGEEREVRSKLWTFNSPRWFPDGKSLLVRNWARPNGLFKIDSETGDAALLVPEKPGSKLFQPVLSRDGKAVFYENKHILWKRNLETGEDKEIYRATPPTEEEDGFTEGMALSPDGQRLAFILKQSLFVVPATGGDARELLKLREPETFAGGYEGTAAWTPDGRYLLFVQSGDKQSELWRIPADGGDPQKLGQLMKGARDLRAHPDGQRIAFTVQQSGRNKAEVWVMENFLPTTQPRKAPVTKR